MALYLNVSTNKVYVDNGLSFSVPYAPGQIFEADPTLPTVQAMLRAVPPPIVPYSLPGTAVGQANGVAALDSAAKLPRAEFPSILSVGFTGAAAAGSIVLAGATVGMKVVSVFDVTGAVTSAQASFESTISIAGHIQQLSATDLSTSKFVAELL